MSFRYPAGLITASSPVNANYPSGVWTPRQALPYLQNNVWGQDPFFDQTVLLLHGDGTNGAQNNTFLDSSSNNFTITRNGNTTQGTFTPFSLAAGEWSNYFDGNGDYLQYQSNAAFEFGTGNFTIEFWWYPQTLSTAQPLVYHTNDVGVTGVGEFAIIYNTSLGLRFYINAGATIIDQGSTSGWSANQWYHVAAVRNGNTLTIYRNGVSIASGSVTGVTIGAAVVTQVGGESYDPLYSTGYISNYRVVKGRAVYTSAFTPSTVPLGATSGGQNPPQGTETSLLTCQSNRFVDNSSTPKTITPNGDVRVTPFSPFQPLLAYSPGVTGGSGYFDGTSDWLNVGPLGDAAFNFGTGAFTIEGWIYPAVALSATTYSSICAVHDGVTTTSWGVYARSNGIFMYGAGNIFVGGGTINSNTFTHFAVTRSGNTVTVYVNGEQVAQNTGITGAYDNSGDQLKIGDDDGTSATWNGYIASLRIIKGQALTTGAFTPPTAPVTTSAVGWTGANVAASITGTVSLLCNFTNAGIIDNTGKNNLETVGNAQIDTTTKKFGDGSMEFDGTGDWLLMPNTPDQQLGTGNFTIEFWVYLASGDTGSARGLVAKGTSTTGWLVSLDSSQKVVFTYTTSTITSTGAITTNAWNHIAVVREGTGSNLTKIYIGGTNDGTGTVSTDFNQTSVMYVGANRTGGDPMKGFIDDLRITKGIARYTANFIPPIARMPNQ